MYICVCICINKLVFVISSKLLRKTKNKHCFLRKTLPCHVTPRDLISIDE